MIPKLGDSAGRVLILGSTGQVGTHFKKVLGGGATYASSADCPFTDVKKARAFLDRTQPELIINCAAYTAVDKAEAEPALAMTVNSEGPRVVAQWCAEHGAVLVHFSTDYVFDGLGSRPYVESDPVGPQSSYGRSKLEGERAIRSALDRHFIFRISWVFSEYRTNFLKTMLRVGGEQEVLRVVADQWGSPSYAGDIVEAVLKVLKKGALDEKVAFGTYHLCNSGYTNWNEFARHIFIEARARGWPLRVKEVAPIASHEFAAAARRPANSRLDTSLLRELFGIELPSWQSATARCLDSLKEL